MCGRVEKRYPDPLIVANLPFSEPIFDQVRVVFRQHGSIARVINRNTSCTFMDMPFQWTEDPDDVTIVYNCRTAATWPGDMALSVSFEPKTLTTYAVLYGCDEKTAELIAKKLTETDHPAFHPMILPTVLADLERERQVALLRADTQKIRQLTFNLTLNKEPLTSNSMPKFDIDNNPIRLWQNMSYLRNGMKNWQRQMQKMGSHLEDLSNNTLPWAQAKSSEQWGHFTYLEELRAPGFRIMQRRQELIDEYDEHIRECNILIQGLDLALSTDTRQTNQEIAHSSLEVSRLAQKDGNLMKSIAFLTMIYLPATFASVRSTFTRVFTYYLGLMLIRLKTFFSMDFFDWPYDEENSIMTHYIWVYAVVAIGLTVLTVAVFVGFTMRGRQRESDVGSCKV
ncbi:corA-like mg2+ transporter domain-containing [Fusarium albosuccineum]|uniref:CorA-like mg2+ transporter domain-containing n=1 Tax=Fusarium albosuccineum TaxID=1237068 RepID=A0A8H4LFK4_9HYPO|nr:corA-like mg2+ transporter domain-containing [Fusarium albosuccineum]